jgi:ACS family glucarate transporter-like MFS transporter
VTTADLAVPVSALRPTRVRYLVLTALCVITAINYLQRNCIGAAESTIRTDLGLIKEQTGAAMAWFFWSYALFQIPSGWLAQRWGPRLALTLYAAGWSLAIGLGALSAGLAGLVGTRLALGVLQAGVFPCATLIMASWLPPSRRAFASGLLNSCMLIGGAFTAQLTGLLLAYLGWRELFGLYALPGIVWAVWFAVWFRNRPQDHRAVNPAELELIAETKQVPSPPAKEGERDARLEERIAAHREGLSPGPTLASSSVTRATPPDSDVSRLSPWWAVFLSVPLWLICAQQFCRAGANRFFDHWLPTYLQEEYGESVLSAAQLSSLPLYAAIVGGLVGGWFSDTLLRQTGSRRVGRQGVAVGSLLVATLIYVPAYLIADAYLAVLVLSAGYFLGTFSAPCAYALTIDMGGRKLGVVFGTMNMIGNFGSGAFVWVVPRLNTWSGGWDLALAVFAGLHLLAAVCWLLVNPNGAIGERPATARSRE